MLTSKAHGGAERPSPRAVVEQWASIKKGCYDRGAVAFFTGEGGNASRRAPPRQQPAPTRRNKNARPRSTGTQEVLDQVATSSDTARRPARARKRPASLSQVVLEISSDESDKGEDSDPKRVKVNVHDVDRITNDRNKGGLKAVSGNPSLEVKVANVSVADPEAMLINAVNGTLVSDSAVEAIIVSEPDERSKESSSHVNGDGSCSRTTRHKQLCQPCQARKLAALTTERGERNRPQSSDGSFNFTFVGAQQESSPHRLQTHRRSSPKLGSFESQLLSVSTQGSSEESLTFSNGGLDMEESSDESLVFANGSLDRYGKRPMDRYMSAMESPEGTCMFLASTRSLLWLCIFSCISCVADQLSLQRADSFLKHAHPTRSCQGILWWMNPSTSQAQECWRTSSLCIHGCQQRETGRFFRSCSVAIFRQMHGV